MEDQQEAGATGRPNPESHTSGGARFAKPPSVSADWFQRHWLGLILLGQLGLTTMFIVFAAMYGFTGSTIFFGALAGYNLVALLFRLLPFGHRRICQLRDDG